jgi:hypothetical protein
MTRKNELTASNTENQPHRWRRDKAQKQPEGSRLPWGLFQAHKAISYYKKSFRAADLSMSWDQALSSRQALRPDRKSTGGSYCRESLCCCPKTDHFPPKMPGSFHFGRGKVSQCIAKQPGHRTDETQQGKCTPSLTLGELRDWLPSLATLQDQPNRHTICP